MMNQSTLQGNWNEIKGKLHTRWGQLSNDELESFKGNVDQLVGLIQRKTGEARSAVEEYLDELTVQGRTVVGQAGDDVREYVQHAADRIQEGSRQAVEGIRQSYEDAEDFVRERPSESMAVCFGAGVLFGLMIGLTIRSSR